MEEVAQNSLFLLTEGRMCNFMSKKKILFIVNPISGTDKKRNIRRIIRENLDVERFEYKTKFTEYAGHAAELAKEAAAAGVDIVAAVGGDGTVNEVARSLVHTQTALGIVPCGSGNGLARHLQIPLDTAGAIRVLNADVVHSLDYGIINNLPFFCTCGVGFDAFVSQKFAESGKRGPLSYIENTLREGLKYNADTYTIEDENGTVKHKAFLIACANASQYGNNAFIAPHASMKDGLMDIIVMEPFPTIEAPQVAFHLFNNTLLESKRVKTFRARKIRITRAAPGAMHCDGEPLTTGAIIDVEMVPSSFKVVVNPHAKVRNADIITTFVERINEWAVQRTEQLKRDIQDTKRRNHILIEKIKKL